MESRYKTSNLHGSEAKEHWRKIRIEDLMNCCKKRGVSVVKKTDYQYRVGNKIDFYPTNGCWHILESGKRGDFHTANDIYKLLGRVGFGRAE